ncbi:MAG: hypothetical protein JWR34_5553 [Mycobacterium sp.]|jgi:hypothetical protein|nr:hypothetical protein [Mycobacterium sp.]
MVPILRIKATANQISMVGKRQASHDTVEGDLQSTASRLAEEFGQLASRQPLVTAGDGFLNDTFVGSNIASRLRELRCA